MARLSCTVKQYRPNVERQKWLYSMKQSRDYIRRLQGKPPEDSGIKSGPRIPDNSEPWLPGGVHSVADALWISDQIKKSLEKWKIAPPPEAIDLLVTKMATDREKDLQDIAFLEAKVERDYLQRLPRATTEEAQFMLGRFLSPKVAEVAFGHPDPTVRDLALKYLREMETDGNPFARDILQRLNPPA